MRQRRNDSAQRLTPARFATVFDVGAHVGDRSVEALAAWPSSHVHVFEVAPATFDRLMQRIDADGLSARFTLNSAGLSDTTSPREIYYFPDHPKLTCGMARHAAYRATRFDAQLVEGDAYVEQHGIAAIDFLKIDVEGAEHLVLKGLQRTMKDGRSAPISKRLSRRGAPMSLIVVRPCRPIASLQLLRRRHAVSRRVVAVGQSAYKSPRP